MKYHMLNSSILKNALKYFTLLFLLFLLIFTSNAYAQLKVIYPNVNGEGMDSFGYSVLKLALEKSGKEFELTLNTFDVNNARIRILIKQKKISISDFGTSVEFEQEFLPIYFPIDLGLNGWRIFLIHNKNRNKFIKVSTLKDLRKLTAGQGIGWSDIEILENAGLKVTQGLYIENLFLMTEGKRFDYFPLGANEVHSLLEKYKELAPNVVVEQQILLIYPFARMFFLHRDNKALHKAVETGLVRAFEDGSFMKLFKSHKSTVALFTKTNLKNRTQILIDNPNMSEEFKKIPKKYFFRQSMLE